MDSILRFTRINYSYPNLLEQRRAGALTLLVRLAFGLALAILVILALSQGSALTNTSLLLMAPVAAGAAIASLYFGNRGQLRLASWIYVGVTIVAALALVALDGLNTTRVLALALPFFVAGLLLDRRGVLVVTGLLLGGLLLVGVLEVNVFERLEGNPSGLIVQIALLVVFFGIAEWYLLQQFEESLA